VNLKRVVISSYSDLKKIHRSVRVIHFRKFASKKVIKKVLIECPKLEIISLSRFANKRYGSSIIKLLQKSNIKLIVSNRKQGRPSMLERRLEEVKLSEYKLNEWR